MITLYVSAYLIIYSAVDDNFNIIQTNIKTLRRDHMALINLYINFIIPIS